MIPAMISIKLNTRPILADSPNKITPAIAVPTAPIPTQTAYAVPTGKDFIAIASNQILVMIAKIVPTVGQSLENPLVYFKPTAQTTSNMPAMTRVIQFILSTFRIGSSHEKNRCLVVQAL